MSTRILFDLGRCAGFRFVAAGADAPRDYAIAGTFTLGTGQQRRLAAGRLDARVR